MDDLKLAISYHDTNLSVKDHMNTTGLYIISQFIEEVDNIIRSSGIGKTSQFNTIQ